MSSNIITIGSINAIIVDSIIVKSIISSSNKVDAIMLLRWAFQKQTGKTLGLREAKDTVEAVWHRVSIDRDHHENYTPSEPFRPAVPIVQIVA